MPTRRSYSGSAKLARLATSVSSSSLTIVGDDLTGWPDGSTGKFHCTLETGGATEESFWGTTRTGNTITVTAGDRGVEGTSAAAHSAGVTLYHTTSKTDLDEANAHTSASSGVHGVTGDVVGTTDTQVLTHKTLNGAVLDAATTHGGVSGTTIATMPFGRVGGATTTTATSTASVAFISGLSDVSFTAVAGRRYKVTVMTAVKSTVSGDHASITVRDGGASAPTGGSTPLGSKPFGVPSTAPSGACLMFTISGLSVGTHRLGVEFGLFSGSGTITVSHATAPLSELLIEDIGT